MICTRRQIELTHRYPHQTLTFVLQLAKLPNLPDAHIRIAEDRMPGLDVQESGSLNIACCLDGFANGLGRFSQAITAQLFIIHTWDFDVNVIQSNTGSEMRFRYFVTTTGAHPHAFCGLLSHPHGQGINRGYHLEVG